MGFAVWSDGQVAWAEGTHEYRPMGAAVVAVADQFRARDFQASRRVTEMPEAWFVGYFASVGAVNAWLTGRRGRRRGRARVRAVL